MNVLAELLSSQARAEIFRLLFGLKQCELHMREIERQSRLAYGTIRQELGTLAQMGLVEARKSGNRTYYRANIAHPLFPDIRALVLKTSGLVDILRERLNDAEIQAAFVFGSLAAGTENASSDIDLMVIGSTGLRQIAKSLSGLGAELGREVNPHVLTVDEFLRRKAARDHFLTTVLAEPKLFVIGNEDELEAMGKLKVIERRGPVAATQGQPARGR